MEIGKRISNITKFMNHLLQFKEIIKKAKRLLEAQILATKNGDFIN